MKHLTRDQRINLAINTVAGFVKVFVPRRNRGPNWTLACMPKLLREQIELQAILNCVATKYHAEMVEAGLEFYELHLHYMLSTLVDEQSKDRQVGFDLVLAKIFKDISTMPHYKTNKPTIDLDELLHGNPSWEDVADFWQNNGEFYEESYLVEAIKKYLRTDDHRKTLGELDLSIEDLLNGRYNYKQHKKVDKIFDDWNQKLGFIAFGFM